MFDRSVDDETIRRIRRHTFILATIGCVVGSIFGQTVLEPKLSGLFAPAATISARPAVVVNGNDNVVRELPAQRG